MRTMLVAALLALLVALGWGLFAGAQPAPSRPQDLTAPVAEEWRAALPRDADAAAAAYLDRVPAEMRARGEAISNTRYFVFSARIALTIGAILLFLYSGAAAALAAFLARRTKLLWLQDMAFAAIMFALLYLIVLPVDVYAGYVRSRTFGFSDRPFFDWLRDSVVGWAIITAFYVVGVAAFLALMRRKPHSWVNWAAAIYLALAVIYVIATPTLIEPLFNKYTPIADSPLKQDILAMAHANGVPADDVYTGDASRQTRLLNAHVSGLFGTARISIDDNTLANAYPPGVRFVVGHEIAHYVLGHIFNYVVMLAAVAAIGFALIGWAGHTLIKSFGHRWKIAHLTDTAGIAVFWLIFAAYTFASLPVTNAYSRWQEHQADLYGLNASQEPHGMAEFMIHDADTARLSPTPLDVFLFYSHPSDKSRVETAMRWRAEHLNDSK
ncbi:MAG: M48 family metalloprotease [Hyphomonadaceae bacterium]|nr:M48 family metalloprotease [Hyphomonadaceae bacterium]